MTTTTHSKVEVVEAPSVVERRPSTALPAAPHLTVAERVARGKAARGEVPRTSHGEWGPHSYRSDPIALLEEQDQTRVPELVPIRYGRMLATPFAFYRGAALVMAADLAATPDSGLRVQICADAHLSNFGGYASPERAMVFDINDFDETIPGPWEWDVKRLAASLSVAGRSRGFNARERVAIVRAAVREYREAMNGFAGMGNLDVWYARMDEAQIARRYVASMDERARSRFAKRLAEARSRDSTRAMSKLATTSNGNIRIISDPPLVVAVDELVPAEEAAQITHWLEGILRVYRRSLQGDRRHLLSGYRYVHLARKVVGVGSVGLRAWVALLVGRDETDPLFLQFKEAQASVAERFVGGSEFANSGQRVVEGQRLLQTTSDIFLGWFRVRGLDGRVRDFYGRQLWDWKVSAEVETMRPVDLTNYGRLCGWTLARAHARSGDRIAIAAYLGSSDVFDRAIAAFAELYAEQSERDHAALAEAVRTGRVAATTGM